jgi:hypothetical protein
MYKYLYFLLISVLVVPSNSFGQHNRIGFPLEPISTTGVSHMMDRADSTYGDFTEISPVDSLFYTVPEEDFWVVATAAADYDNDGDMDILQAGS